MAFPFLTVSGGAKEVWQALLTKKEPIETIVIGLPLLMNGQKGEMALLAEAFGKQLAEIAQVPIVFFDERLSSRQADLLLKEQKTNRKRRTEKLDPVAAAIMLQSYLDQRK